MFRSTVLILLALANVAASADDVDVGAALLFTDVLEECENSVLKFKGVVPDYVKGTFIQGGPARWSWGNRKLNHLLDGYAKIHRFEFKDDGSVAFTSKFLQSGFYKESKELNDIAFSVTAEATIPPHEISPRKFMKASNDNNQVNNFILGDGNIEVLSDYATMVEIDKTTLEAKAEYNPMHCSEYAPTCTVQKNVSKPFWQIAGGGSAHPHMTDDGDYLGLREDVNVVGAIPDHEVMSVYRVRKDQRDTVEDMVKIPVDKASYAHAFGISKGPDGDHVIVVQQPIYFNPLAMMKTATLKDGYVTADKPTKIYLAPLQFGAKAVEFEAPEKFFFGHFVNAYQPAPGKFIADINIQDDGFFDRFSFSILANKTLRDSWPTTKQRSGNIPGYMTPTRYEFDLEAKTVTSKPLFGKRPVDNAQHEQDLFRLHPADYGKPYCGYWSWQTYYNSSSFLAWAVVRSEICGENGPVVAAAWYRPNYYIGEPIFVPKPGSTDKTEGAILFKALNGNTGHTHLIVADAKTMNTIAESVLPVRIPFTVHGNWYPASGGMNPPEAMLV